MQQPPNPLVLLVFIGAVSLCFEYAIIRATWENFKDRHWVRGRAVVLGTKVIPSGVDEGPDRYNVYARLRTADGGEFTGWAASSCHRRICGWVGYEVDAWYDPADRRRFMLEAPDSGSVAVLKGVLMSCLLLAFFSAFAVIVYLLS